MCQFVVELARVRLSQSLLALVAVAYSTQRHFGAVLMPLLGFSWLACACFTSHGDGSTPMNNCCVRVRPVPTASPRQVAVSVIGMSSSALTGPFMASVQSKMCINAGSCAAPAHCQVLVSAHHPRDKYAICSRPTSPALPFYTPSCLLCVPHWTLSVSANEYTWLSH